jgi:hypothetical protein
LNDRYICIHMKKLSCGVVVILALCAYTTVAQIVVSDPLVIADQNAYGNVRPRIALNAANNPVIIWADPSNERLWSAVVSGESVSTPVMINPEGTGISSFDWYGPDIASSGDDIAVVFKLEPELTAHSYVVMSNDGGYTWGDTVLVENSLPMMSRMPALTMDENGNPWVAYMREDGMGFSEWVVTKSIDGGISFLPPVSATSMWGNEVCDCCPASLLADGDLVVLLYRNNEDNLRDIRMSVSFNGGASFALSGDLDELDWVINACPSTGPSAYLVGDEIRSAWMSGAGGESRVYFSSYDVANEMASPAQLVEEAASNQDQNFPIIAGDDNNMGIALEQIQSGQRDIYFAWTSASFEESNYQNLTESLEGNQMRPHMVWDGFIYHLVFTDNGGDAVRYMTVNTGVNDVRDIFGHSPELFPNPARSGSLITFSTPGTKPVTATLASVAGQSIPLLLHNQLGSDGQFQAQLPMVAPGLYSISWLDDVGPHNIRLVIE